MLRILLSCLNSNPYFPISIAILFIASNLSYAQTSATDNLRNKLSNTTSIPAQIKIMNELSRKFEEIDPKQSFQYAQKALSLSRSTNNKAEEARAMFNLGLSLFETPEADAALMYFESSALLADSLSLKALQSDNLMRIANWYRYHRDDSTNTVSYLFKSVEVSKAAAYHYGTGRSYAKLASFYTRFGETQLCKNYLKESAKYYLKTKGGNKDIAHYYNEVGNKIWVSNPKISMDFYFEGLKFMENYPSLNVSLGKAYSTIGAPKKGRKYLKEAVAELELQKRDRMLGLAMAQLAKVEMKLGNYKAAQETVHKAEALLTPLSIGLQSALPTIYITKGSLLERENRAEEALEFYTKSLDKAIELNRLLAPIRMITNVVEANIILGKFYADSAPEKAEKYCKIALRNSKKNRYTNLEIEACECLYDISKKAGQYENALSYFEQKKMLNDSISTLKVGHAIKVTDKNKLLAEQSYQKERKEVQLKNQKILNTTLAISTGIGLLFIVFLIRNGRKIRKQNTEIKSKTKELEEANENLTRSNEDLERFAHVASHDLKSPLTSIISFSGLIRKNLDKESSKSNLKDWLNIIEDSGNRMSVLISDILEYSKLSSQISGTADKEIIELNKLVKEISVMIQNNPQGKAINIEASDLPNLKWKYSKIFLLFKNLIENGLKYNTSEHPTIKLDATMKGEITTVYIQDNGIGIKKEYYEKIFIMFQRLHNQKEYEGTGLGLATCKKIVDEFNGKISLTSTLNEGTTFKIEFPESILFNGEIDNQQEDAKAFDKQILHHN